MITVKLFPTLRDYSPPGTAPGGRFTIDMSAFGGEVASVGELLAYLRIPPGKVNMAIINGIIVRDVEATLKSGDRVFLSPAVSGG
jgi:molybdopterin converting factor small subunit